MDHGSHPIDFIPQVAQGEERQGRQGDRPRRRRRPRHDRPGHRRRLHLRQGDRVGHPPARDARRDHLDPVARIRTDRGDRVLRVHLRPDRVLPLADELRTRPHSSWSRRRSGGGPGQLPRHAERRADDLDAARVRRSRFFLLRKLAFPRIQEALDKRRLAIEESIRRGRAHAQGGRPAARASTASGCVRRASRPTTSSPARARPRTRPGRGRVGTRRRRARRCWRTPAATSSRRRAARSTRSAARSPT